MNFGANDVRPGVGVLLPRVGHQFAMMRAGPRHKLPLITGPVRPTFALASALAFARAAGTFFDCLLKSRSERSDQVPRLLDETREIDRHWLMRRPDIDLPRPMCLPAEVLEEAHIRYLNMRLHDRAAQRRGGTHRQLHEIDPQMRGPVLTVHGQTVTLPAIRADRRIDPNGTDNEAVGLPD